MVGPSARFEIPKIWKGKTALLCGSGPSLDWDEVYSWMPHVDCVVGINNTAIKLDCDLDLVWASDLNWWRQNQRTSFPARAIKATLENYELQSLIPGIWCVHSFGTAGFHPHPDGIMNGSNGGYAALHLLAHMGVSRVLLMGIDCAPVGSSLHWHPDHKPPLHNPSLARLDVWRQMFEGVAPELKARGIEVFNASSASPLDVWPRIGSPCALSA